MERKNHSRNPRFTSKWLPSSTLALLLAAPLSANQTIHQLPFQLCRDHKIIVKGTIEKPHPARMLIDTGSSCSVVDRKVIEKLRLPVNSFKAACNAVGQTGDFELAVVRGISLGPIKTSRSCLIADIPVPGVDLIVGVNVLRLHDFAIDFESKTIIFGPPSGSLESTVRFDRNSSLIIVPFRVRDRTIRLYLDTGTQRLCLFGNRVSGWITGLSTFPQTTMEHLDGKCQGKEVHLRDLMLGPSKWDDLKAILLEMEEAPKATGSQGILVPDGFVGTAPLGLKRIHFDFQRGILSWQH